MKLWGPMRHNPWPRGMTINVDDVPHHLLILLFIRQAWGIAADADVRGLDPLPFIGGSRLPDSAARGEWEARWHRAWARAWDWYRIQVPDPTIHPTAGFISAAPPGQDLDPFIPPFWQADFGWAGIDADAFTAWEGKCGPPAVARRRGMRGWPAAELPEPRSLQALIAAWEDGLDTVIVLPYSGYFARRITNRHLAVSAATRNDPVSYSKALGAAADPGSQPGAGGS